MTKIPHRSNDGWDRIYGHEPAPAVAPELTVTENPVVRELLGPKGDVIRQVRERPPFGYRGRGAS